MFRGQAGGGGLLKEGIFPWPCGVQCAGQERSRHLYGPVGDTLLSQFPPRVPDPPGKSGVGFNTKKTKHSSHRAHYCG